MADVHHENGENDRRETVEHSGHVGADVLICCQNEARNDSSVTKSSYYTKRSALAHVTGSEWAVYCCLNDDSQICDHVIKLFITCPTPFRVRCVSYLVESLRLAKSDTSITQKLFHTGTDNKANTEQMSEMK